MKKLFSIILSVVFLIFPMANLAFAEETEEQITNIAPKGVAYSSSEKNSLWTPVDTVINGKYGVNGEWQGWECAYPEVSAGQDTSNGFGGEYFGINFKKQCYEIYEIKMNVGLHTGSGGQNATYTFEALIDGKWEQIAVLKDEQAIPVDEKYKDYNAVMSDPNASTRVTANLYCTLENMVSTNNVRVTVSDYAKNYEGGDVLIFPFVYELELYGKKGYTPEIILPEGASYSTDVAWHSYPSAAQSSNGTYPLLAIDGNDDTYWEVENYAGGEYFTLMFDNKYDIASVRMILQSQAGAKIQSTVLEYYIDDLWQEIDSNASLLSVKEGYYGLEYEFKVITAAGIRVKFKRASDSLKLCSIEAHLDDSKTYAFDSRFTQSQLAGASNGNLAIIGEAYASNSFTPYSDVNYINDGLKNDKLWFTGTIDVPEYCGLTFDYPQKISKAVITVRTPNTYGTEAMGLEIQALVNGEYVKIAEGKSFCKESGYTTAYTFNPVETTDVRVVITDMGGAIPNVSELELYNENNSVLPMLQGIEKMAEPESDVNTGDNVTSGHICEKNTKLVIITVISVVVAVSALAAVVIIVIKKKKKEV